MRARKGVRVPLPVTKPWVAHINPLQYLLAACRASPFVPQRCQAALQWRIAPVVALPALLALLIAPPLPCSCNFCVFRNPDWLP